MALVSRFGLKKGGSLELVALPVEILKVPLHWRNSVAKKSVVDRLVPGGQFVASVVVEVEQQPLLDVVVPLSKVRRYVTFDPYALGSDFDCDFDRVVLVRMEIRICDCPLNQSGVYPGGHFDICFDPSIHFVLYYGCSFLDLGYD